jgi:hypothetical protein
MKVINHATRIFRVKKNTLRGHVCSSVTQYQGPNVWTDFFKLVIKALQ